MVWRHNEDVFLTTENPHYHPYSVPLHCYCVVPENIHTPTTEGIGNSEGEGVSKSQEIPEGRGLYD